MSYSKHAECLMVATYTQFFYSYGEKKTTLNFQCIMIDCMWAFIYPSVFQKSSSISYKKEQNLWIYLGTADSNPTKGMAL